MDETLDARDITATIVGLAVKGYIKIEETKEEGLIFDSKDYYLAKLKEADDTLPLFERELMSDIFGSLPGKMVSELKNHFYAYIDPLKKTVYSELTRKKYFTVSPDKVRQLYAAAGFVTAIAATVLLGLVVRRFHRRRKDLPRRDPVRPPDIRVCEVHACKDTARV